MSVGFPNDSTVSPNFIFKVRDPEDGHFKPCYVAPDATDEVRGDVYLSDVYDQLQELPEDSPQPGDYEGTGPRYYDSAYGVTAATPFAVQSAYANSLKLDFDSPQTVNTSILPAATGQALGSSTLPWDVYGTFHGQADTALKLSEAVTISLTFDDEGQGNNTITFDRGGTQAFKITSIPADTIRKIGDGFEGYLSIDVIADGAIPSVKLARNSVTMDKIADGSVSGLKLTDHCVTTSKLDNTIFVVGCGASTPSASLDSRIRVYIQE